MEGNYLVSVTSLPDSTSNGTGTEQHTQPQQRQQQQQQQQQHIATNEANKRAAFAGQWRTPPLPIFPSAGMIPAATVGTGGSTRAKTDTTGVDLSQLPDSTEDYAKALQEAYKRGAEAAQAMAAASVSTLPQPAQQRQVPQAQATIMPSSSCPDFVLQTAGEKTDTTNSKQPASHSAHLGTSTLMPTASPAPQGAVPNPLSMPPPPPVMAATNTASIVKMGLVPITLTPPTASPLTTTPNASLVQQQQQLQTLQESLVGSPSVQPAPGPLSQIVPPPAQRSMSLPDMNTYAAQQEEEKRQKRLARNRASARLRRLRKKNLVEAYEQEVGILEKTLAQLQAHEWGETDNVAALTEALSMDRGQQVLTYEQRHDVAVDILDQQLQWIEMLEEIMMEDYVLQNIRNGEFAELQVILGLDEAQLNQIEMSKVGWEEQWTALQTLKASVIAMRENDWLWNESVSSIAEQFMTILHKNQVSKFLLWADHNAEAIDELDGVNPVSGPPSGPVFAFGVESQLGEGFGEEEK